MIRSVLNRCSVVTVKITFSSDVACRRAAVVVVGDTVIEGRIRLNVARCLRGIGHDESAAR